MTIYFFWTDTGVKEDIVPVLRPSGHPNQCAKLPARYRDKAAPPKRQQQRPAAYQDDLPTEPPPIFPNMNESTVMDEERSSQSHADNQGPVFRTLPDKFGVYRVYPGG